MRVLLLLRLLVLVLALFAVATGALAGSAFAGAQKAKTGFYVFKDFQTSAVIEFRDMTGAVVWSEVSAGEKTGHGTACGDSRHTMVGARWGIVPGYFVNTSSFPAGVGQSAGLADLRAAHEAWQDPWVTDCSNIPGPSPYQAFFSGTTDLGASLATLTLDGSNVVEFRSLTGTVCDAPGAIACVVAFSERGRFVEADMLLEEDLAARLGGDFRWTTGDRTFSMNGKGEVAVIDVATHEAGHFAGLGHVNHSPALTMFPVVHDEMQTLGLGDMKGILARY